MVGCFDVPLLAAFIAAAQKNDERTARLVEIYAVAGPIVDPEFTDAVANR